ncbi:MAG TPA: PBP1A family penicillin-binding protein, partial [Bryobacteraceae bacterium]|nr:PBP1A family penicillin-binding protein [Bryobacteraceae bacterium]
IEVHPAGLNGSQPQPFRILFEDEKVAHILGVSNNQALDSVSLPPEFLANLIDNSSRERRSIVRFEELPKVLVNAVVSVEDKRFWKHAGFDGFRIGKAAYIDLREGRKQQGASTITMQLARGLWLEPEKAWKRKLMEFLITLQLEAKLSKQQILEHYCNQIYLGRRDTFSIHGFGEASQAFFSKDLSKITLPEAAMLAGMIQRPAYYNPFRSPDRVKGRRNVVLGLMLQNGYITQAEYQQAIAAPIILKPRKLDTGSAPYFMPLAQEELQARLPEKPENENAAYRVVTSLDLDLQQAALDAVETGMRQIDRKLVKQIREAKELPQVALIALDPHSGEVKAVIGGRDFSTSQFNRALAKRQPGSAFKPFVYAAALSTAVETSDSGNAKRKIMTPMSTVVDEPTTFRYDAQTYQPGNFGDQYYGEITLKKAISRSANIATIKVAEQVGYGKVVALAKRAGLNNQIQPTPAMALGSYEATPLEMAGAYTIFANSGLYTKPTFLKSVTNMDGRPALDTSKPLTKRALDERVSFLMVDMLQEVVRSGTASGIRSKGINVPVAGKTGTSRDGWFAGFVADLLCVVWVGFDDNTELDLEGSKSALIVWTEFMKRALALNPGIARRFEKPAGVVAVAVDPWTGQLASENCPGQTEYFVAGTQPKTVCEGFIDPYVELTNFGGQQQVNGTGPMQSLFRGLKRVF